MLEALLRPVQKESRKQVLIRFRELGPLSVAVDS